MTPNERLEALASALEQNAEDPKGMKFDLGFWLSHCPTLGPYTRDCGTSGCAIGLAMLTPELIADGLECHFGGPLVKDANGFEGQLLGFDAVMRFFDIDNDTAANFFSKDSYPPDQQKGAVAERAVAERIRAYLAGQV